MLGRALFAFVCLLIAGSLLLPAAAPQMAPAPAADGMVTVAADATACCGECAGSAAGATCPKACACSHLITIAYFRVGTVPGVLLERIAWRLPAGQVAGPEPLPPKLPAI